MMKPMPHQIAGAEFLAERRAALLADAPRVGKTGAAIMAADMTFAQRTLVVTTASGRPVWERAFRDWSAFDLSTEAVYGKLEPRHVEASRLIVGWPKAADLADRLPPVDLLILDESHYAKNPAAQRTRAVYDRLAPKAGAVWCLTGTPIPNAPNDLWPMLAALAPERIDHLGYDAFVSRYCTVRAMQVNGRRVEVVTGGKNEADLRARLDGFWLRRTQKDVGIDSPVFDLLPIRITDAQRRQIEAEVEDAEAILAAAESGETREMEMHLGTLRRVTGTVKAAGVVEALADEFQSGLEKVVLMCWHRDVMDVLQDRLARWSPVRLDGATSPGARARAVSRFQTDPECRVFIGQMLAAGEAIDLSAAAELIFVESSFVPKDMAQAALRVTNHRQRQRPRVRVAALAGSIDEAVQAVLMRKTKSVKEITG